MTSVTFEERHTTSTIYVFVAIVMVAITGAAALVSLPQTTTPPPFVGVKTATVQTAAGLLLGLAINQTSITTGQTIAITIYERNTLQENNNVSASDRWPANGLGVGPCGRLNMPFGIAVYRGNLSVLDVPGKPLQLYEPGAYNCPMMLSKISAYVFQPLSSQAQVVGSCTPNPCFTSNISSTIDAKGYWGTSFFRSSFTNFSPGIYAVVAGDEWGDFAVLNFYVVTTPIQATISSETCAPAITLTQTSASTTTTEVITLCHKQSTYTPSKNQTG